MAYDAPVTATVMPNRPNAGTGQGVTLRGHNEPGGGFIGGLIAAAAVAAHADFRVAPVLRTAALVRDSVGLTSAARERNITGRVRLTGAVGPGEVLLVDDIVTTGATAREAVRVLAAVPGPGNLLFLPITLAARLGLGARPPPAEPSLRGTDLVSFLLWARQAAWAVARTTGSAPAASARS